MAKTTRAQGSARKPKVRAAPRAEEFSPKGEASKRADESSQKQDPVMFKLDIPNENSSGAGVSRAGKAGQPVIPGQKMPGKGRSGDAQSGEGPSGEGRSGGSSSGTLKNIAVIILALLVVALAFYIFTMQKTDFVPAGEIDSEAFKSVFMNATKVYIVMDVRGVGNASIRGNILQCGVDFAGSTGFGSKDVTPFSLAESGCESPKGTEPIGDCVSALNSGLTILVREGAPGARYYSNGMIVSLESNYTQGTCGIKLV